MGFGNLMVRSVISSKITENPLQGDRELVIDISKIYNHGNKPSHNDSVQIPSSRYGMVNRTISGG